MIEHRKCLHKNIIVHMVEHSLVLPLPCLRIEEGSRDTAIPNAFRLNAINNVTCISRRPHNSIVNVEFSMEQMSCLCSSRIWQRLLHK